ncbi:DUF4181 domain-containing protein [Salipaludibacillus sp. HK11]|uniref:DUF4181 domain-containing protein n=1 Tax=Salipaludibacillus sp. HK11 TaxID=3394320 RepID=UPI0039FC53B5
MNEYGVEPVFWLKLVLLIAFILLLLVSFNIIMRKWWNVERKKFFSDNHVNEKHTKIDMTIRITGMVSILLGSVINITIDPTNLYWFLKPWFILFIFIVASQIVTAIMERKYAQNPNAYKVTISEIIFGSLMLFTLYKIDPFGLL